MSKKHQIFSSNKKTRTKATRKWRRAAKLALPKPTKKHPKNKKKSVNIIWSSK